MLHDKGHRGGAACRMGEKIRQERGGMMQQDEGLGLVLETVQWKLRS